MIISSLHPIFVVLDTSALSNIIQDDMSVERFVKTVLRRQTVIVLVPKLVIFEWSSNADIQKVFAQTLRLQRLCRELGAQFSLSLDHEDLMRAETEKWLRVTPVHRSGWGELTDASEAKLLEVARALPPSAKWLQEKKARLLGIDRSLHRALIEQHRMLPQPEFAVRTICAKEHMGATDMMIERAAELSDGNKTATAIAADPMRFKATHVLAHLVWRLCLANSVERPNSASAQEMTSVSRAQEDVLGAWRTKKRGEGTWYDVFIAGSAAYADQFISDDADQRRRCEFLRCRGLVSFRAVSLAEFLT